MDDSDIDSQGTAGDRALSRVVPRWDEGRSERLLLATLERVRPRQDGRRMNVAAALLRRRGLSRPAR